MSYLRSLGSFLYSLLLSIIFFAGAVYIYVKILINASGFWITTGCIIGISIVLSWMAENGIKICSIPFNWLWDYTIKTRIAAMIPALIVGLWCITAPFRIPFQFSVGDWVVTVIWVFFSSVFYYNLFLFPLFNPQIGQSAKNSEG